MGKLGGRHRSRESGNLIAIQFLHKPFAFDLINQAHVDEFSWLSLRRSDRSQDILDAFGLRARHPGQALGKKFIGSLDRFGIRHRKILLENFQADFLVRLGIVHRRDWPLDEAVYGRPVLLQIGAGDDV